MKCPNCGKEMRSKVRDYEYIESGLKNVVLKSITVHECAKCGEVLPEIANVKQVHKWIAEYLLNKQAPLTGEEFRFLRKAMGKTAKELAGRLVVNPVSISRWENNKEKIGPQSDKLFRMAFIIGAEVQPIPLEKCLETLRSILSQAATAPRKVKPQRIEIPPHAIQRRQADVRE